MAKRANNAAREASRKNEANKVRNVAMFTPMCIHLFPTKIKAKVV